LSRRSLIALVWHVTIASKPCSPSRSNDVGGRLIVTILICLSTQLKRGFVPASIECLAWAMEQAHA
jgi:hypothetical protein